MIHEMFDGTHIDLSKVIAISNLVLNDNGVEGYFWPVIELKIHMQLLHEPLKFYQTLKTEYNYSNYGKSRDRVISIDGIETKFEEIDDILKIKSVSDMQKIVDDLVKIWKDFVNSKQETKHEMV